MAINIEQLCSFKTTTVSCVAEGEGEAWKGSNKSRYPQNMTNNHSFCAN